MSAVAAGVAAYSVGVLAAAALATLLAAVPARRRYADTVLDWSDRADVGKSAACRLCGAKTSLRDDDGEPCHKVCAEHEADRDRAGAVRRAVTP